MNILILGTHFRTGGITSYCLTLIKELRAAGHKVIVVTGGGNCVEDLEALGVLHIKMNLRTKSELSLKLLLALPRLKRIVLEENIDVIHSQTRVTQVLGHWLSRATGRPMVTTCHGFFKPKWGRRLLPCWGEKVIAISKAVRAHLLEDFHVPEEQIALIPNGVDVHRFKSVSAEKREELRHQWNVSRNPVIGIIARLSSVKGHTYLIQAMPYLVKHFPNLKCLIVGEGAMERELKKQVARLDLEDNVLFYKVIHHTANMLPIFDVFVMPSLQEGLGLSAMEAQAAALPVVASRVGGLPDLIEDGETGLLVEPQNASALAEAILKLLNDPGLAKRIGRRAQSFIETHCGSEKTAQETLRIYEGVIHDSR